MAQSLRFEIVEDCEADLSDSEVRRTTAKPVAPWPGAVVAIVGCVAALFGVVELYHLAHRGHGADWVTPFPANLRTAIQLIDWDQQTKLPPWMSPIRENATQGIALVLGQSLNPDGSTPQVLSDRASMAKKLLDEGKVTKVMVCGADPAGVGRTEASVAGGILEDAGVPAESIIQESQSTTTAENAWFALRHIPNGTGQLYLVTSDFHMARATYIFQETLSYFYKMVEDAYRHDPRWTSKTKKYPRLAIHQVPTKSFCGSDASLNRDNDPNADVNQVSLALRAANELKYLGSSEVNDAMYGETLNKIMYIWPVQINVTKDPDYEDNFRNAMAQAMNAAQSLCACKAPPEDGDSAINYPLALPISTDLPVHMEDWQQINDACGASSQSS